MRVAQKLYEGVAIGEEGTVGLISYMRTDSVNLSADALAEIRDVIARDFGTDAVPDKPNVYQTKSKNAQEAHEAIRPTSALRTPAQVSRFLERRRAPPVRADLEARRRLADGAGHAQHRSASTWPPAASTASAPAAPP